MLPRNMSFNTEINALMLHVHCCFSITQRKTRKIEGENIYVRHSILMLEVGIWEHSSKIVFSGESRGVKLIFITDHMRMMLFLRGQSHHVYMHDQRLLGEKKNTLPFVSDHHHASVF